MKNLFLKLEPSIYAVFILCAFFVTGAVLIQLMPADYAAIHTMPLLQWLSGNTRPHTFWLYACIVLFGFISVTSAFCLIKDIRRKKVYAAVFHATFILVVLSHLVNSAWGFRILGRQVETGRNYRMTLPAPLEPFTFTIRNLAFKTSPYGMPYGISADIDHSSSRGSGTGRIAVNEPVRIGDVHVIIKSLAASLTGAVLSLNDGRNRKLMKLSADTAFSGDGFRVTLTAANEDMTVLRLLCDDRNGSTVLSAFAGGTIRLGDHEYRIEQLIPETAPALVLDFTYDPSLYLMFYASTVFTVFLSFQAFRRFVINPKRETPES